jgi:hypothetical protein
MHQNSPITRTTIVNRSISRNKPEMMFEDCIVPADLFRCVLKRINDEEHRLDRRNAAGSLLFSILSVTACVTAFVWVYDDMANSGFLNSFGLIFSDSSTVLNYWSEFSSHLLEVLPYVSLAASLVAISALIVSSVSLVNNRNRYRELFSFTHNYN